MWHALKTTFELTSNSYLEKKDDWKGEIWPRVATNIKSVRCAWQIIEKFLNASTNLFKRACQSVCPSLRPSVGPSIFRIHEIVRSRFLRDPFPLRCGSATCDTNTRSNRRSLHIYTYGTRAHPHQERYCGMRVMTTVEASYVWIPKD